MKLISFKTCPFVQRSVITLLHKGVDFDIEYIDLDNKPDWFLKISPLGKVPVLQIDDEVLFESAVINEYIDEVTEGSLLPENPLEKAKMRAWIEYSSSLMMLSHKMCLTDNEDDYWHLVEELFDKLNKVEEIIDSSGYFSKCFSLVDSSYAPLFQRLFSIPGMLDNNRWTQIPKVKTWAMNVLELDEVRNSVVREFYELLSTRFMEKGSYIFNKV